MQRRPLPERAHRLAESLSRGSRRRLRRRAWPATPAPPPPHTTTGPCRGGGSVYPAPLPAEETPEPETRTRACPSTNTNRTPGLRPDPAPLQRSGEGAAGGDLLTARQRQPDRRPDAQAGKEWPARRATGPAGISPRREEITALQLNGYMDVPIRDSSSWQLHVHSIAARSELRDSAVDRRRILRVTGSSEILTVRAALAIRSTPCRSACR